LYGTVIKTASIILYPFYLGHHDYISLYPKLITGKSGIATITVALSDGTYYSFDVGEVK